MAWEFKPDSSLTLASAAKASVVAKYCFAHMSADRQAIECASPVTRDVPDWRDLALSASLSFAFRVSSMARVSSDSSSFACSDFTRVRAPNRLPTFLCCVVCTAMGFSGVRAASPCCLALCRIFANSSADRYQCSFQLEHQYSFLHSFQDLF